MRNETFNTDINYVPYVLCVEHLVMWCKTGSRKIDAYHQKESHDEERHSYRYSAKSYRIESDRIGPDRRKFDVKVIKLFDIFERIFVEIIGLTDEWKKLSFSEQSTAIRSHFSVHLTHSHTHSLAYSLPLFSSVSWKFADFLWFSPYYVSHEHSLSI